VKAREIIPGWPRGRSTSRGRRGPSARGWTDPRWCDELFAYWKEERRKTEMMEIFWLNRRIGAKYGERDLLTTKAPDHAVFRIPINCRNGEKA
jgi:hypothetical protein